MLFRSRIIMGGQLRGEFCLQGRTFLGWAARNGFDRKTTRFTPLLEIPPDRRERDLKGRSNLSLAMPLVHCAHDALA
jgi:hypothetical protein